MTTYGNKLDPHYSARTPYGVKGNRKSIVVTNNPSTIDANQILTVQFPNLGADDVIIPGTARLSFNIALDGDTDANRTVVNNLWRAIVKKISVKLAGQEVMSLDDADIYMCYRDLWLTDKERLNAAYCGIHIGDGGNTVKIRLGAGDAVTTTQPDASNAGAFSSRFAIPLDFEILTDHGPFYQAGLNDRLSFELTFNDYGRVIKSPDATTTYQITNIALEFDQATNPDLARQKRQQYTQQSVLLYTRILRHRKLALNKSDVTWNINLNTPAPSLKGILLLFEDPATGAMGPAFGRNSEFYYKPLITKVQVTAQGISNQLYAQGMLPYQHWDEIVKEFTREDLKSAKLPSTDISTYFRSPYALWLDFRSSDDRRLHGSGRRVENASEGVTLQLDKTEQIAGAVNCYIYLLMDAQLNIGDGRLISAIF